MLRDAIIPHTKLLALVSCIQFFLNKSAVARHAIAENKEGYRHKSVARRRDATNAPVGICNSSIYHSQQIEESNDEYQCSVFEQSDESIDYEVISRVKVI